MTSKNTKTQKLSGESWVALKAAITEVVEYELLPADRRRTLQDVAIMLERDYVGVDGEQHPYTDKTPDEITIETLREDQFASQREFAGLADRFAADGVSDDFRNGIRLVVQLIADPNFEY